MHVLVCYLYVISSTTQNMILSPVGLGRAFFCDKIFIFHKSIYRPYLNTRAWTMLFIFSFICLYLASYSMVFIHYSVLWNSSKQSLSLRKVENKHSLEQKLKNQEQQKNSRYWSGIIHRSLLGGHSCHAGSNSIYWSW